MDTATIRQQLHNYLEIADDKKVKALFTIIEKDIQENDFQYPEELKNELDKRHAEYKNGTAEIITAVESKKRIQKILNTGRKK